MMKEAYQHWTVSFRILYDRYCTVYMQFVFQFQKLAQNFSILYNPSFL